jgi:hypothetical protein
MHIITGLLLTAFFGKKVKQQRAQPTSPLMQLKWPIATKHFFPGRVRFQIPLLVGDDDGRQRIETQLQRVDGVDSVQTNRVSGSVLIHYQTDRIAPELLFAALIRLLGLEQELERTPEPIVSKEIRNIGEALNRAVYAGTDGLFDLWTGIPLVLLLLGVRKIMTEGTLGSFPAGFTLVWWAYMALFRGGNIKN